MPVEYARQGDWHIAFASVGDGPDDVVFSSNWLTDGEGMAEIPQYLFGAIASYARMVWFDQLGTGHSDPPFGDMPSLETFSETIGVVMDAAGVDRATLVTWDNGTAPTVIFAASHPDRVRGLVIVGGTARLLADDGYPGIDPGMTDEIIESGVQTWGKPAYAEFLAPSMRGDTAACEVVARWLRNAVSPGTIRRVMGMTLRFDVRPFLPLVTCPTLVVGSHHFVPVSQLEYLPGPFVARRRCATLSAVAGSRCARGATPASSPFGRMTSAASLSTSPPVCSESPSAMPLL
jgi:pimeloyl-ACP methyl ester carboxylesterase